MSSASDDAVPSGSMPLPLQPCSGGARLVVRVTPRASRSRVIGVTAHSDGKPVLAIKLAAPPVDGAANKALCDYLAEVLRLPKSSVRLVSGASSRVKQIELASTVSAVEPRLRALLKV